MRVTSQTNGEVLGYVEVNVASRVFKVPVQALPEAGTAQPAMKPGLFPGPEGELAILVDRDAPRVEMQATIEQAAGEAARFLGRKFLN
jgi:hypothetical protein